MMEALSITAPAACNHTLLCTYARPHVYEPSPHSRAAHTRVSLTLSLTQLLFRFLSLQALADGAPRFHPDADHDGFTALHAAAVEGKARE